MPYVPAGTGAVTTSVQTKLRETVSVKDFGAVGDGTTDDTAAIQAAIDSLGAGTGSPISPKGFVVIPNGTYLITNTITINKRVSLVGSSNAKLYYTGTATNVIYVKYGSQFVGNGIEIYVNSSGWTGSVIYLNGSEQYDGRADTCVRDVQINSNNQTGTAIHLFANTSATDWIEFVNFANISVWRLAVGVKVTAGTGGATGAFVNGNIFNSLRFFETKQPIYFISGQIHGNVIDNVEIQMFPTAVDIPIQLDSGNENYITNVWLWDWPAASGNPISLPANQYNYVSSNIRLSKITNYASNQPVCLTVDEHSNMIVKESLQVRDSRMNVYANPATKVFTFSGGANGVGAFIMLEGNQWNGYKRSYFYAINSAGNWIVTEVVNGTSGTAPTYVITNNSTPTVTLTATFIPNTYGGGYLTVVSSNNAYITYS
jgi:hypothetical protein